jgi:hypothetical protein
VYSHRQSATTSIMQIINVQTWNPEFGERVLCLTKRCICSQARCSKWKNIKWGLFTSVSSVLFIIICVILQLLYSSFCSHISPIPHPLFSDQLPFPRAKSNRSQSQEVQHHQRHRKWLLFRSCLNRVKTCVPIAAPAFPNPALTLYPISLDNSQRSWGQS